MFFSPDPGKQVFFCHLCSDIKSIVPTRGAYAVDVASANFKSAPYFDRFHYVGVDRLPNLLHEGVSLHPRTTAICTDVSYHSIGTAFAELAVSTHTIEHITDEGLRLSFVENVLRTLKHNGTFLLLVDSALLNKPLLHILESKFSSIDTYFYHGAFAVWVAHHLTALRENGGQKKSFVQKIQKFFFHVLWGIAYIYYGSTKTSPLGKRSVYLVAKNYQCSEPQAIFPPGKATKIADNFWEIK